MAEQQMFIEVRFFPGSRCLFLFAENPLDPVPVPRDEVLQKLIIRLRGTSPATRQNAARQIEVPYRVDGRIGGRRPLIRILMLEPLSELAQAGEDRIRRHTSRSSCIERIQLLWPDGHDESYTRRSGHRLVFTRATSS
ncbi:MAG: hypothetical protein AAB974_02355 [Patescibacteria group bacterium]